MAGLKASLASCAMAVLHWYLAWTAASGKSVCFDEVAHITAGCAGARALHLAALRRRVC